MSAPVPPSPPQPTPPRPVPPFHGGRIILTALVAQGLGMGLFTMSAPMMTSLQAEFGASRRRVGRRLLVRLPEVEPGTKTAQA